MFQGKGNETDSLSKEKTMEKEAPAEHPIHALLSKRWSPFSFDAKPVAEDLLALVLEAARWAPSCFNAQPWRFHLFFRGTAAHESLLDTLVPGNREWAGDAPVLILVAANLLFPGNGKKNVHAWYDVGQAVGHLTVQATACGLILHQMAGFNGEEASRVAGLCQDEQAIAVAALGHPGTRQDFSPSIRSRMEAPRLRMGQSGFVVRH